MFIGKAVETKTITSFSFLYTWSTWYTQSYLQIALLLFLSDVGDFTSGSSSKQMRKKLLSSTCIYY